jgi:hypothetical protein
MLKKRREQRTHVLVAMREVLAPMWCRKRIFNTMRTKAKGRLSPSTKLFGLPTLKRRRTRENAFCAVVPIIGLETARIAKISSKGRKSANIIIGYTEKGILEYGNHATVLSVCYLSYWWIDTRANIYVCADISLFSSYQVTGTGSVLMGKCLNVAVRGVSSIDLKFTSGKTVRLKNVQHVLSINKNIVSGSLLCKDGFKLVFE